MSASDNPFAPPPQGGTPPPYAPPPTYPAPQGYAPQGYGAPGYGPPPVPGAPYPGWQPAPQTDGKAIAVLVLAICSFVVFPVIPAIVALAMAPGARRDIEASGGRLTGESLIKAGRIVAWINLVLILGTILAFLLIFGFLGAVMTASTGG